MNLPRLRVLLAAASVQLCCATAMADVVNVNVSATFQNSSDLLIGSFTVDTAGALVLPALVPFPNGDFWSTEVIGVNSAQVSNFSLTFGSTSFSLSDISPRIIEVGASADFWFVPSVYGATNVWFHADQGLNFVDFQTASCGIPPCTFLSNVLVMVTPDPLDPVTSMQFFTTDSQVTTSLVAAAIPEPQTYALLLAGLALLGFTAGWRKPQRI